MLGYTENKIVIMRDFDHVFDLSNHIELWPQLFTEYESAEVLVRKGDYIKFRLTTFPEDGRPSRSWVSERQVKKDKRMAEATRLDPTFPFKKMNIRWEYETLPSDQAVIMTWIQEFEVHPDCPFSKEQMESFLNRNTRQQMRAVKKNIEEWTGVF